MFKKITLLLLCGLAANYLAAQSEAEAPPSVSIITYWSKGDTVKYEIVSGSKVYKNDAMTDSIGRKYFMTLVVTDSLADAYIVKAKMLDKIYDILDGVGINGNYSSNILKLIQKYKNFEVIYKISDTGAFEEVKNMPQLVAMLKEINNVLKEEKGLSQDSQIRLKLLGNNIESPDYIMTKVCSEPAIYHQYHGLEYNLDSIIAYQDAFANTIGGEPLTVDAAMKVQLLEDGYCMIQDEKEVDEASMQKYAAQLQEALNVKPQKGEDTTMTISDFTTYVIDYEYGWVSWYEYERAVGTANSIRIQFMYIQAQ